MKKLIVKIFSRDEILKEEKDEKSFKKLFNIILCNKVRIVYIIQSAFFVYFLIGITGDFSFFYLLIPALFIFFDSFYVSIFRLGKEPTWFSISTFCYSIVMLTSIWKIVNVKFNMKSHVCPANRSDELQYTNNFWLMVI
jgi:hypothetical protein